MVNNIKRGAEILSGMPVLSIGRLCNEVKATAACLHFCLEYTSNNLGVCHVQDHIPAFFRRVWSHRVWSAPEMYSAFNLGGDYQLGRWHAVYEMIMYGSQDLTIQALSSVRVSSPLLIKPDI
jgi:hypothetical protein